MASVFLTGASGFVGREVHQRLIRQGHRVVGLARQAMPGQTDLVYGDLTSAASYQAHLAGVDTVVHLGALTGKAAPAEYNSINFESTRGLIDAARRAGVARLLFCSTIAVTFPDIRRYYYAQSKVAAERAVADSGLGTVIVRPTIVAGRGSPVMSRLWSLAALPVVPVFGGGRARVQPILVEDLADFIVDLVAADRFQGEVLEFGGPEVVSLKSLLGRMHLRARGGAARFLPVPLGAVLPIVSAMERMAPAAVPVTVGQLATFRFDGIAQPNDLWTSRRDRLASLDRIIEMSAPA